MSFFSVFALSIQDTLNLFINDVHIWLAKPGEAPLEPQRYNFVIDSKNEIITKANLINHVLLLNATQKEIDTLLSYLDSLYIKNLLSITIVAEDFTSLKDYLKSNFKVIHAAGGVVRKGKRILMIYRLKKWDLPKGKINKKESPADAAVREVEEECNVKVKVNGKICNTWHTYTMKKQNILKKTTWFSMKCKDDSEMKPQLEEDIELLNWMTPKEVFHVMDQSYNSVHYVVDNFYKIRNKKTK